MAPPPPNVSYILPTQNRADEIRVVSDEVAQKAMQGKNGLRPDGTRKGLGFFGALATRYGGVMTEFSVGFTYDGKNVDVPTLNPLLTRDEISYLLRGYIFEDDATWKNILDKTARWGAQRLKEGKSPFIEDGEPRIPIPQSNDIRFSIRVNDDLADLDKFNAFKSAMAIEQPMPEGVNLLPEGVSPFEALRYFEENILGKTIRMPDGETLTLDIGHFFRLVCDGSHGKKGYVEGFDSSKSALAAIRKNEVLPEKINGYQSDRARMLPVFLDTVEHPVIEMQEKNEPSKTQFVKRYDVDGGRGVVAAFRYIKDGKKIQSFHGFSTRYGKVKKYRITYVDDAAIRGASPDAPELTNQQAMYNVPQSAPTVNGADVNSRSSIEANVANARLKSQQILDDIKGAVLGDAINKDFKETSTANLIGQTITSPADLAALAQIYRNPSFETFRYFFVKNGEVVWQTGVTARLPSNAPVTVPAIRSKEIIALT